VPATYFSDFDPNRFSPLTSSTQAAKPVVVSAIIGFVRSWRVEPPGLLEVLTNLYRDFPGRLYDPSDCFIDPTTGKFKEVFLNMEPLETAPLDWWCENFQRNSHRVVCLRVRQSTIARWQAIGTIVTASFPAEASTLFSPAANINFRCKE